MFLRRVKRSKNEFAVAFTRKNIFNTEAFIKNLNITLIYLKSSHLENEETHLIIVCYFLKLNSYFCFDIARQKKKSVIVISILFRNYIS